MSLAAELSHLGYDASATAGARGQFDVVVDGGVIFSKQELGRFPAKNEIAELLGS